MFGSCFLKLFLKIVFKNIENTILVFYENRYYFFNLVFFCIIYVFQHKKKGTYCVILIFLIFENITRF